MVNLKRVWIFSKIFLEWGGGVYFKFYFQGSVF
jgi:hypothetical protein